MEQEEAIDSILCETPSLLPTLSLSLASGPQAPGPQAPEVPVVAPAATATPTQTTVNSHNQAKGIKVGGLLMMGVVAVRYLVFCLLLYFLSLFLYR